MHWSWFSFAAGMVFGSCVAVVAMILTLRKAADAFLRGPF